MVFVHFIVVAVFVVLGIVFSKGKGAFLIAGYNTSSPEEKSKYNVVDLCKFMGKIMFALAFCFLILAINEFVNIPILFWIGLLDLF